MAKKKKISADTELHRLEEIKKLVVVIAMFSDDDFDDAPTSRISGVGTAWNLSSSRRRSTTRFSGTFESSERNALKVGPGESPKFTIDISQDEYTEGKEPQELNGFRIFVYSPEMMVAEKLRAICQQMEEYGPVVNRKRPGGARARDFLDIHTLVVKRGLDMAEEKNRSLLAHIFEAKKAPLSLLGLIAKYREFHRADFAAVEATIKPGVQLKGFDFYFDYVMGVVGKVRSKQLEHDKNLS